MEENLEISPISSVSNCSKCLTFMEKPEFNHSSCRQHRICFNKEGYNPEACDICCVNRDNWFDESNDEAMSEWKKILIAHQKNSKNFLFAYGSAFNQFFKKNKRSISTTVSSKSSKTSDNISLSVPAFDSMLSNSSMFKSMQESLNKLTQILIPRQTTPSSSRRDSIVSVRSPSPSPTRIRSTTRSLASDRPSRSRTPQRSRSPIKSVISKHSLSPSTSEFSNFAHPFDTEDPSDFKSEFLRFKVLVNCSAYFEFHPRMIVDDVRGIFLDNTWKKISRHPTFNAFKFMEVQEDHKSFIISNNSSSESFKKYLNRELMTDMTKIGTCFKAVKVDTHKTSTFSELLKPLKTDNNKIVAAILNNDHATLSSVFSNFKSTIDVCFDSDWPLSKSFKDFATPEAIKLIDTALLMSSKDTPFVPEKFLKKEKDLRMSVVDSLSGFFSLSHAAQKAESQNDSDLQKFMLTTIRQFLSSFKNLLVSWIKAKTDIRKIFLQDSKSSYAHSLMLSNPWSVHLFDPELISEMKKNELRGKTILQACGWSENRNKQLRVQQSKIDLSQPSLLKFDTKPNTYNVNFRQRGSDYRNNPSSSSYKRPYKSRSRSRDNSFRGKRTRYNKNQKPEDNKKN